MSELQETKPILEKYQKEHKVFKIDAMQSVDFASWPTSDP